MDTNQHRPKSDEVIPYNMNPYRPKTEKKTPTHMTEPMQRPIQVINSRKRPNHRDESGISPKEAPVCTGNHVATTTISTISIRK